MGGLATFMAAFSIFCLFHAVIRNDHKVNHLKRVTRLASGRIHDLDMRLKHVEVRCDGRDLP